MNLQNFKQTYVKVISESADDRELRNYIRSIVEEVLGEVKRIYPGLEGGGAVKVYFKYNDNNEELTQQLNSFFNDVYPKFPNTGLFRITHAKAKSKYDLDPYFEIRYNPKEPMVYDLRYFRPEETGTRSLEDGTSLIKGNQKQVMNRLFNDLIDYTNSVSK